MDEIRYRVYPEGTVQEAWESPYSWMSDDYEYVMAINPEEAWRMSGSYFNGEN